MAVSQRLPAEMGLSVDSFDGEQETRMVAYDPARKPLAPVSEYPENGPVSEYPEKSKKLQELLLNLRMNINTQASTK